MSRFPPAAWRKLPFLGVGPALEIICIMFATPVSRAETAANVLPALSTRVFGHLHLQAACISEGRLTADGAAVIERRLAEWVHPAREAGCLQGVVAWIEDDLFADVVAARGAISRDLKERLARRSRELRECARVFPDCAVLDSASVARTLTRIRMVFERERLPLDLRRWLTGGNDHGGYDSPKAVAALLRPQERLIRQDSDVSIPPEGLSRLVRTEPGHVVTGQYAPSSFIDRVAAGDVGPNDAEALLDAFAIRLGACVRIEDALGEGVPLQGRRLVPIDPHVAAAFLNGLDRELGVALRGPISGAGMVVAPGHWDGHPPFSHLRDYAMFCDDRLFCAARPDLTAGVLPDVVCRQSRHPRGFTAADALWHLRTYLTRLTSGIVALRLVPILLGQPRLAREDLWHAAVEALGDWSHLLSMTEFRGTLLAAFVEGDPRLADHLPAIAPEGLRAALVRLEARPGEGGPGELGGLLSRLIDDLRDWAPGGAWSRAWGLMREAVAAYPVGPS